MDAFDNKYSVLATQLHKDQVDKINDPYVEHLRSTVEILLKKFPESSDFDIGAAWLHDVLEDTDTTEKDLLGYGIEKEVVAIVKEVTRDKRMTYLNWITKLANTGSKSAIRIKLCDNYHNSDLTRASRYTGGTDLITTRYTPARVLLLQGLGRVNTIKDE